MSHWVTKFDQEDGTPYGLVCDCAIDADHYGNGTLVDPPEKTEETTS